MAQDAREVDLQPGHEQEQRDRQQADAIEDDLRRPLAREHPRLRIGEDAAEERRSEQHPRSELTQDGRLIQLARELAQHARRDEEHSERHE